MNNKTTFYIVRHGETQHNVAKIIQGHNDSPLTENGLKQAESLIEKFKDVKFDMIFSSDLLRAERTAEIVAKERDLEVEALQVLRERNWGELEGKSSTQYDENYKDYVEALSHEERFKAEIVKGFESDEKLVSRFLTFLRETALANPGKSILIISHGTLMRVVLIHLGFATYDTLKGGSIENTGYFVLESDGIEFEIKETHGITLQGEYISEQ